MKKIWKRAAALTIAVATLLSGCSKGTGGSQQGGASSPQAGDGEKTVTVGIASYWNNLNPLDISNGGDYKHFIEELIFDRMVVIRSDGSLEGRILSDWEVSEDGLRMTGHVNPSAAWQDGEKLTARDIAFTFGLYANPEVTGTSSSTLQFFTGTDESGNMLEGEELGVRVVDEQTIQFDFKDTTADTTFFYSLKGFTVLPEHLLANADFANFGQDPYFRKPVGSGACVYDSEITGERIEFTANKNYFMGTPDFDRLVVRVVDSSNMLAGLMSGEIDIAPGSLSGLSVDDYEVALTADNLTVNSLPSVGYTFMPINNSREYFKDPNVRLALDMAINKQSMIDNLFKGQGTVAYSTLCLSHAYHDPSITGNPYDPEGARKLLEEAGWDFNRELVMMVSSTALNQQIAVLIQQDLQAIGVKMTIEVVEFSKLMAALPAGEADLGIMSAAGSVGPEQGILFYMPGGTVNFACITDPTVYDLYLEGLTYLTFEERAPIYYEIQHQMQDNVQMVYLYNKNTIDAQNKRITGTDNESFYLYNWCVWEWKVD